MEDAVIGANRDSTKFHALAALHRANYKTSTATELLLADVSGCAYVVIQLHVLIRFRSPPSSCGQQLPLMDPLEGWSSSDRIRFVDGLRKCGKQVCWKGLLAVGECMPYHAITGNYAPPLAYRVSWRLVLEAEARLFAREDSARHCAILLPLENYSELRGFSPSHTWHAAASSAQYAEVSRT